MLFKNDKEKTKKNIRKGGEREGGGKEKKRERGGEEREEGRETGREEKGGREGGRERGGEKRNAIKIQSWGKPGKEKSKQGLMSNIILLREYAQTCLPLKKTLKLDKWVNSAYLSDFPLPKGFLPLVPHHSQDPWQTAAGPTLWRRLTRPSLYSWLPSIMPVRGLENHSLNSRWDWKTWGIKKCIKDHSSMRLFCKGVPVRSRRLWLQRDRGN